MKKLFSFLLAIATVLCVCSANVFAAEISPEKPNETIDATMYDVELNSNGIVSITDENGGVVPLSTISGYSNGDLTDSSSGLLVWTDASGIGGMGVTITTSCSTWNGTMTFDLIGNNGSHPIKGEYISSNGSKEFHNLLHTSPSYFLATFSGIPSGHTVHAQIWIYG